MLLSYHIFVTSSRTPRQFDGFLVWETDRHYILGLLIAGCELTVPLAHDASRSPAAIFAAQAQGRGYGVHLFPPHAQRGGDAVITVGF